MVTDIQDLTRSEINAKTFQKIDVVGEMHKRRFRTDIVGFSSQMKQMKKILIADNEDKLSPTDRARLTIDGGVDEDDNSQEQEDQEQEEQEQEQEQE